MSTQPAIFCAIDTADLNHAVTLAETIGPLTGGLKLGLEFFSAYGPEGVEKVMEACPDAKLFLDLKFHDIPNTVAKAVNAVSKRLQPAYLNVHAGGGLEMMKAARDACWEETQLLAVTVLTSLSRIELEDVGMDSEPSVQVERLARLSIDAGLDGVVCSALEIQLLRQKLGDDFVLMVPGIRPAGKDADDQKRVMTPQRAMGEGATHLVIGRPITHSDEPVHAAQAILDSIPND